MIYIDDVIIARVTFTSSRSFNVSLITVAFFLHGVAVLEIIF